MKESDLSFIAKAFLYEQGCTEIHGEICDIDLVGFNKNIIYALELKTKLNLKVVEQAMKRIGMAHLVYIGIPYDYKKRYYEQYSEVYRFVLDKLGIGLVTLNPIKEYNGEKHIQYQVLKHAKLNRNINKYIKTRANEMTLNKEGGMTSEARFSPYKKMMSEVYHYLKNKKIWQTEMRHEQSMDQILKNCPLVSKHYANPRSSLMAELKRHCSTFETIKSGNKNYYRWININKTFEEYNHY